MNNPLSAAAQAAHEAGKLTAEQRSQLDLEAEKLAAVNWLFLLSLVPVIAKFIPGSDKWLPYIQTIIAAFRGVSLDPNGNVPDPH